MPVVCTMSRKRGHRLPTGHGNPGHTWCSCQVCRCQLPTASSVVSRKGVTATMQ